MHTLFLIKNSTFLRTQGLIIGLFSIIGILIFYPISFILQTDLIWTTTLYGIAFHLAFPFIVFYSFSSYFIVKHLQNKTTSIIPFYIFTILICAVPYLINFPSLFIGTGDIGLGLVILLGALAPVNLLILLLFTLIPMIKTRHKQTTLPFTILNNKPIYYISSIGIAVYILNVLLFTTIAALTIISFTHKFLNP